jgi:hypothetical protein
VVGNTRLVKIVFSAAIVHGDFEVCAESHNIDVRKSVAANQECPENILIKLAEDEERLNKRPRKRFGYPTPNQVFFKPPGKQNLKD